MRKLRSHVLGYDRPPPRRPGRARSLALIAAGLALSPVLYETAALCVAQWRGLFSRAGRVDTPLLDTLGLALETATRVVRYRVHAAFLNLPWEPSLVIVVGVVWALFMGLPLRRGTR